MQRSRRLHEVCGRAFFTGASPSDFAAQDYETIRAGRATRPPQRHRAQQLGLQAW